MLTAEDREKIEHEIRKKYMRVSQSPEGSFRYPTGREGLIGQSYDPGILKILPEKVQASYCGVGNPFSLGPVDKGEEVLDIGCGAGVDTLVAGLMVGPEGKATGIDLIPEMLGRAKTNLEMMALDNVRFQKASGEKLPFPDESFDAVISNGVFNLIPDKLKALKEVFRVLRSAGRFMIADQVLTVELPEDSRLMAENWAK